MKLRTILAAIALLTVGCRTHDPQHDSLTLWYDGTARSLGGRRIPGSESPRQRHGRLSVAERSGVRSDALQRRRQPASAVHSGPGTCIRRLPRRRGKTSDISGNCPNLTFWIGGKPKFRIFGWR